jgi:hypothetical protein
MLLFLRPRFSYQTACLTPRLAPPVLATIGGTGRAVSEVTLNITTRYAGDNYQVRATMQNPNNEPFDTLSGMTAGSPVVKTTVKASEKLIAWKRVYIEQDNMYTVGCTITADKAADADANDDVLTVDSSADFSVNDSVVIFWQGGSLNTQIKGKTATTITVPDLTINIPQWAGIRPLIEPPTQAVSRNFIVNAFGNAADGSDGGAFIEFRDMLTGNKRIPKYKEFPSDGIALAFCAYWFNAIGSQNVVQLVIAWRHSDGSFGTTLSTAAQKTCFITKDNDIAGWTAAENTILDQESIPHELGHLWLSGGQNGHVDLNVAHACHQGAAVNCVMSYHTFDMFKDGTTEFCFDNVGDCLDDLRQALDPIP